MNIVFIELVTRYNLKFGLVMFFSLKTLRTQFYKPTSTALMLAGYSSRTSPIRSSDVPTLTVTRTVSELATAASLLQLHGYGTDFLLHFGSRKWHRQFTRQLYSQTCSVEAARFVYSAAGPYLIHTLCSLLNSTVNDLEQTSNLTEIMYEFLTPRSLLCF